MGFTITDAELSLFGGYHIKYYIDDDGTITEAGPSPRKIVGYVTNDGTITGPGTWRKILGHIESDGTITEPGCYPRKIIGHITNDGTITDHAGGYCHILGHIIKD